MFSDLLRLGGEGCSYRCKNVMHFSLQYAFEGLNSVANSDTLYYSVDQKETCDG